MNRHERRAFEAQARSGRERANARLRAYTEGAYASFEVAHAAEMKEDGAAAKTPCTKGCAHCCNQLVTVSLPEAEILVSRYPALIASKRQEMEAREDVFVDLGGEEAMRDFGQGSAVTPERIAARSAFLDRWYMRRMPCVLLDPETKTCRVYHDRPLACRSYYVLEESSAKCDPDYAEQGVRSVEIYDSGESYSHALRELYEYSNHEYGQIVVGSMNGLLLAALDKLGERLRVLNRRA